MSITLPSKCVLIYQRCRVFRESSAPRCNERLVRVAWHRSSSAVFPRDQAATSRAKRDEAGAQPGKPRPVGVHRAGCGAQLWRRSAAGACGMRELLGQTAGPEGGGKARAATHERQARPIGGRREACGAWPGFEATRRAKLAARTARGRAGLASAGDQAAPQAAQAGKLPHRPPHCVRTNFVLSSPSVPLKFHN